MSALKMFILSLSDRRYLMAFIPIAIGISSFIFFLVGFLMFGGNSPSITPKVYHGKAASQNTSAYHDGYYKSVYDILDARSFRDDEPSLQDLLVGGDLATIPQAPEKKAQWELDSYGAVKLKGVSNAFCKWVNLGGNADVADKGEGGARCYRPLNNSSLVAVYRDAPRPADELGFQVLNVEREQSEISERAHIYFDESFINECPSDARVINSDFAINTIANAKYCLPVFEDELRSDDFGVFYPNQSTTFPFQGGGYLYRVSVFL